jgi:hypothetical protein
MNRAEILARIRDGIGEPVDVSITSAGYWSDAELYRYIEDGINSMCEIRGIEEVVRAVVDDSNRIPVPNDPTEMTYIDQMFLYSTNGTTTFSETMPASPSSGDVWIVPSTMVYKTYNGTVWVTQDLPTRTDLSRSIDSIEDGYIKFTSKQSGLLELVGYRIPKKLTDDTTDCEIPEPFVLGVVEYALAKAASKDENVPKQQEHLTNFYAIKGKWEARRGYKRSRFVDHWYA